MIRLHEIWDYQLHVVVLPWKLLRVWHTVWAVRCGISAVFSRGRYQVPVRCPVFLVHNTLLDLGESNAMENAYIFFSFCSERSVWAGDMWRSVVRLFEKSEFLRSIFSLLGVRFRACISSVISKSSLLSARFYAPMSRCLAFPASSNEATLNVLLIGKADCLSLVRQTWNYA